LSSIPEARRGPDAVAVAPLIAFFLAALALRPQLVGIGPLLPAMQAELDLPHGVGGLLTTLPVLCMAIFALPAVRFGHHVGLRSAMAVALAGILVFGLLRPVSTNLVWIFVMTAGLGIAMGIGGALLPRAVKAAAPQRVGFATGIYTAGITVGALFPLTLALPVDAGRDESEVAGYAAMMLTGGYAVAAIGPVALGALRDATGSFALSLWVLVVSAIVLALLGRRPIVRATTGAAAS
jgi:CP family cyanate transporter-like MFS transporter